jgi:hypothetical protein
MQKIERPTEVNDRWNQIWNYRKGNRETLTKVLNNFICTSLYGATEKAIYIYYSTNEVKRMKPQGNNHKNSRRNRSSRKRYSYARCQELFHEYPKKLVDVVVNNDRAYLQPARHPPEAAEVMRLYEDL